MKRQRAGSEGRCIAEGPVLVDSNPLSPKPSALCLQVHNPTELRFLIKLPSET